jgi:hypothetical protein
MDLVRLSVTSSAASAKSSSIGQRWVISLVFALAALFLFVFPVRAQVTTETQKLVASDAQAGDQFGFSVAASTDVLAVGAPGKDVLFGTLIEAMGAVYIFTRDPNDGSWQEQTRLIPLDGGTPASGGAASLGESVATNGDFVVAGAPGERAVYIYKENGAGGWPQVQKIGRPGRNGFGSVLAISGNRLIVGAQRSALIFHYDTGKAIWEEVETFTSSLVGSGFGSSVAIDGDSALVGSPAEVYMGEEAGAAHLFRWNGTTWEYDSAFHDDGVAAGEEFGHAVATAGTTLLVSASRVDLGGGAGKAFVFENKNDVWNEPQELTAQDTLLSGEFGWSLALESDRAVVSDNYYDGCCGDVGRAYVFTRNANGWQKAATLGASDSEFWDLLGSSTALSGDTVILGSAFEDEMGDGAGAAYVFELEEDLGGVAVPSMEGISTIVLVTALLSAGLLMREREPGDL